MTELRDTRRDDVELVKEGERATEDAAASVAESRQTLVGNFWFALVWRLSADLSRRCLSPNTRYYLGIYERRFLYPTNQTVKRILRTMEAKFVAVVLLVAVSSSAFEPGEVPFYALAWNLQIHLRLTNFLL